MNDAMIGLLGGIGGAVIGAVGATLGPLLIQRRQERHQDRNQEQVLLREQRQEADSYARGVLEDYIRIRVASREFLDACAREIDSIKLGVSVNADSVVASARPLAGLAYWFELEDVEEGGVYRTFMEVHYRVVYLIRRSTSPEPPFGDSASREKWLNDEMLPALEELQQARAEMMADMLNQVRLRTAEAGIPVPPRIAERRRAGGSDPFQ
ncbi:hypothetical protein [Streptomyces viridochromogenes]|uniref:hypothetical protein n=1 Tax=Streptomyces viridochromogenes TaxID=1938 RepID=UPI00131D7A92|nr:hypothetical protein [Streptomyces viridochromogenes]